MHKDFNKRLENTKRNVWIPNMTKGRLEKLLSKDSLTSDDKEDLLDFKYILIFDKITSQEKGLMDAIQVSQAPEYCDSEGVVFIPKNKFWITSINSKTEGFKSKYYI